MKVAKKHSLIKNRVEIYRDFVINLVEYIYKYYLDKETLSNDDDIYNHFVFCFKKVCNEFLKEEIDFTKNEELKTYFFEYFYHQFYTSEKEIKKSYFIKFWDQVFDVETQRNKNVMNLLSEVYAVFDSSISKKKNILELI